MRHDLTICAIALVATTCVAATNEQERSRLMHFGSPRYMPVLVHQIDSYVLPSHVKAVVIDVPDMPQTDNTGTNKVPSHSDRVLFSLSRLYPDLQFTKAMTTNTQASPSAALSVRAVIMGGIVAKMRGVALVGRDRHEAIYTIRAGAGGDPWNYGIVKEEIIMAQPTAAASPSVDQ